VETFLANYLFSQRRCVCFGLNTYRGTDWDSGSRGVLGGWEGSRLSPLLFLSLIEAAATTTLPLLPNITTLIVIIVAHIVTTP